VSYTFDSKEFEKLNLPTGTQYGFIAQELEDVIPALVSTSAVTELEGE